MRSIDLPMTTEIRTLINMEEGYEKIFVVLDRLMHRHGKY
jgi:hypothetical protein